MNQSLDMTPEMSTKNWKGKPRISTSESSKHLVEKKCDTSADWELPWLNASCWDVYTGLSFQIAAISTWETPNNSRSNLQISTSEFPYNGQKKQRTSKQRTGTWTIELHLPLPFTKKQSTPFWKKTIFQCHHALGLTASLLKKNVHPGPCRAPYVWAEKSFWPGHHGKTAMVTSRILGINFLGWIKCRAVYIDIWVL